LSWAGRIYPYVKSTGVYHCPDDATLPTSGDPNSVAVSYNYNASLVFNNGNGAFPGPIGLVAGFNAPAKTVLLNEISGDPVDVVTDTLASNSALQSAGLNGVWAGTENTQVGGGPAIKFETGILGGRTVSAQSYIDHGNKGRHNDGSNFLLCDGHAKWFTGSAVSSGFTALDPAAQQTNGNNPLPSGGDDSQYPFAEGTSGTAYAITFSAT